MELSWYSPTNIEATEIARYSAQILPYVAEIAHVVSVEDGIPGGDINPLWWRQIRDTAVAVEQSQGQAPLPVYHIGNNPVHLPIHELSQREPGIIILHDISLVDLAKCLSQHRGEPGLWQAMMLRQHGDSIGNIARNSESSVNAYNTMVTQYPLFQPFVEKSLGIVVHSCHARDILAQQLPPGVPVLKLNLPYPDSPVLPERNYSADQIRIVFCGHVGPNRRLAQFMEAWGALEFPGRIHLEIFGNVGNSRQLERIAENYGVADYLEFHGYVDDEVLNKALQNAHFALNLRWPTMGETSASQLRYWAAGLPTLVTDVGWYAELPDTVVCKVPVEDEVANLVECLEDILAFPGRYQERGVAGWKYLRENHSCREYAVKLVEFARQRCDTRLSYRTLDAGLVDTIASLCEEESALELFRQPVGLAVDVFAGSPS